MKILLPCLLILISFALPAQHNVQAEITDAQLKQYAALLDALDDSKLTLQYKLSDEMQKRKITLPTFNDLAPANAANEGLKSVRSELILNGHTASEVDAVSEIIKVKLEGLKQIEKDFDAKVVSTGLGWESYKQIQEAIATDATLLTKTQSFRINKKPTRQSMSGIESIINFETELSLRDQKNKIDPNAKQLLCANLKYDDFLGKNHEVYLNITSFENVIYKRELGLKFPEDFSIKNPPELVRANIKKFKIYWEEMKLWQETCTSDESISTSYGIYSIPQYIAYHGNFQLLARLFLSPIYTKDIRTKPINYQGETMLQWIDRELAEKKIGQTVMEDLQKIKSLMEQTFALDDERLRKAKEAEGKN